MTNALVIFHFCIEPTWRRSSSDHAVLSRTNVAGNLNLSYFLVYVYNRADIISIYMVNAFF